MFTISICNHSGGILAKEGYDNGTTITDVISTIWTDYNGVGEACLNSQSLNYLIIENEDSFIIATHLYGYIVCMKAKGSANLGLVKLNLDGMTVFLRESCKSFSELMGDKSAGNNENNND